MYILMTILVLIWGLDYSVAKHALDTLDPLTLLFFKYLVSLIILVVVRAFVEKGPLFKKKDIIMFVLCAFFGDVAYYFSEYTAMDYMPVSLISIVLTFVPVVSILIERIMYKKRAEKKVVIGVFVCVFGVALIIGIDWNILFQGRAIGYLLAFACVLCWNIYNFITASLHKRYSTLNLTLNQLICTCLIILPYVLHVAPPVLDFTPTLIWEILYLGVVSSTVGFLIYVRSLHVLGPTTSALFSNFLPVTATFFGWLILGEVIAPIQFVGGAIVIFAGFIVIKELGKAQDDQIKNIN